MPSQRPIYSRRLAYRDRRGGSAGEYSGAAPIGVAKTPWIRDMITSDNPGLVSNLAPKSVPATTETRPTLRDATAKRTGPRVRSDSVLERGVSGKHFRCRCLTTQIGRLPALQLACRSVSRVPESHKKARGTGESPRNKGSGGHFPFGQSSGCGSLEQETHPSTTASSKSHFRYCLSRPSKYETEMPKIPITRRPVQHSEPRRQTPSMDRPSNGSLPRPSDRRRRYGVSLLMDEENSDCQQSLDRSFSANGNPRWTTRAYGQPRSSLESSRTLG